jgi:hypothetical protein
LLLKPEGHPRENVTGTGSLLHTSGTKDQLLL